MTPSYGVAGRPDPSGADRSTPAGEVVDVVAAARVDPARVVLEGVHALKHALRFAADVELVVSPDPAEVRRLLEALAPDVVGRVAPVGVRDGQWRKLVRRELPSPALSVARRPAVDAAAVLATPGRIVVLEGPRHLGNVGAAVRVVAAASGGGLLVVGDADPWHPTAVRAAAGLQFAVPCARAPALPPTQWPVIALDPSSEELEPGALPADAVLLFGTERAGLSESLRARADRAVALPMRAGVSSLNLATAVAATLYRG